MTYQFSDPADIPGVQRVLRTLEAEIAEGKRAATALATKNAQLHSELQRRLAESESFNRVLVSLLQKTVLDQVLDIICTEAQGLIGATGSAVLLLTDQAWLEVRHRLGKPLAAVEPVPVDGSLAGQVVRQGAPMLLNDPAFFERAQLYQWPTDLSALLAVPLHVNGGVIGVLVDVTAGYLQELQETAQEGMRDMRLLIFQLHPPVLKPEGLGGLRTIAERTARIGGVLTYDSRPGKGTRMRVEVAL